MWMINIEYGNVTCRISGCSDTLLDALEERLSYELGGFGHKNERKLLFKRSTGVTYTGLIPHAIQVIRRHGEQVNLVDKRVEPEQNADFKLSDAVTPYAHQQNVFDHRQSRMIVQMATGAGKTLVLAGMIALFNVKPVVVMSPKATLAYQLQDELSKFLGIHVGVLTGDVKDICDVTVATPQTALGHPTLLPEAKAFLVDECQFLGSRTLFKTARLARNAFYRCAVSATPWRDGDDDLLIEAAVNVRNPRSNVNASTLIKLGRLTACTIFYLEQPSPCGWQGDYAATYDAVIANNSARNTRVVDVVEANLKSNRGSVLVLFTKVDHGERLRRMIVDRVKPRTVDFVFEGEVHQVCEVELIDGCTPMDRRAVILQAVRERVVTTLLGSTIADEGLDCPALKVLVLAGAGKSSTRAFQRVGRVLRLFKGYDHAYVYDFMDQNQTFFNQFLYRDALYNTEPEWAKSIVRLKPGELGL